MTKRLDFETASELDLSGSGTESRRARERQDDGSSSMALRETRQLRRMRCMFTSFLLAMALGVGLGVYFLLSKSEEAEFEANFEDRAAKIIDTFHTRIAQKVGSVEALSYATTSYAMHKNLTWPFVTLPNFAIQAASIRSLSQAVSIMLFPLVTPGHRVTWEEFSRDNLDWIDQGLSFEQNFESDAHAERKLSLENIEQITQVNEKGERGPAQDEGPFFPGWQSSPVAIDLVNLDLHSTDIFSNDIDLVYETETIIVGKSEDGAIGDETFQVFKDSWADGANGHFYDPAGAVAKLYFPVFDVLEPKYRHPVAVLTSVVFWESFLSGVLPPHQGGLFAVIENDCDQVFTYEIHGDVVEYVGPSDRHDTKFNHMKENDDIFHFAGVDESVDKYRGVHLKDACGYHIHLYPTQVMEDEFKTARPWAFFVTVVGIFLFATATIFCYDRVIEKNYQEIYKKAKSAGAIVSSIFPAAVRKRLYQDENSASKSKDAGTGAFKQKVPAAVDAQKMKLKGFLNEPAAGAMKQGPGAPSELEHADDDIVILKSENKQGEKPIADLFPDVTILFADIVGFTAWSSQREPGEIFTLLQNLYHEFDTTARELNVFKVETIGDCYVAATGLPEAQADHAVRMARFATKCMASMIEVTRQLEVRLGPDTGELRMRVGLHSGPVTAGVLRGTKARFQLFGDTMNMAARMEHNSLSNRIQCSETTADLLRQAGKEHWVCPREDKVQAKGKGEVQTYWLVPKSSGPSDESSDKDELELGLSNHDIEGGCHSPWGNSKLVFDLGTPGNRYQRLIDWNVELLSGLLKQIEAKRRDSRGRSKAAAPSMELQGGSTALDEVTEIITLPQFDTKVGNKKKTRPENVELSVAVITQLRDYVTTIASMYRDNSFHNFEHASHVTMSTNKLLKRVVIRDAQEAEDINPMDLHDYTYGITSDPLTQFTLVFCALVHDVDHAGVSNFQLIKEGATIAQLYKNKSVAEQNSVDLAWDLLMDPNYQDLQKAIYGNDDELKRFRQLMVNIVLATDIFDVDMKAIRERRWGKAFQYENDDEEEKLLENEPIKALQRDYDAPLSRIEGANLKATIVMEHLIQASDVAHTMQHWEVYLKWNERLFNEMYVAFENGRAVKDPSIGWYEGEIMFFDKYILPLAKKLDDCGVFGVASDECLNYASQNRKKWAIDGDRMVEEFVGRIKKTKEEQSKMTKGSRTSSL